MKTLETSFLSKVATKGKLLLPATMIALSSLLSVGCSSEKEREVSEKEEVIETKGKMTKYEKVDYLDRFIDIGEGIYYYEIKWSASYTDWSITEWQEISIAMKQFLEKHKDIEIIDITMDQHWHTGVSWYTIITKSK